MALRNKTREKEHTLTYSLQSLYSHSCQNEQFFLVKLLAAGIFHTSPLCLTKLAMQWFSTGHYCYRGVCEGVSGCQYDWRALRAASRSETRKTKDQHWVRAVSCSADFTCVPPAVVSPLRNYTRGTHQIQKALAPFHGLPETPDWRPCFALPCTSIKRSFLWDFPYFGAVAQPQKFLSLKLKGLPPLNFSLVDIYFSKSSLDQSRPPQAVDDRENVLSNAHRSFFLSGLCV